MAFAAHISYKNIIIKIEKALLLKSNQKLILHTNLKTKIELHYTMFFKLLGSIVGSSQLVVY